VHAVEIADRQHAPAGRGRDVIGTVNNDHGWSGLPQAITRGSLQIASRRHQSAVAAEACILPRLTSVE
jgi:hypothetical protein